MSRRGSGKGWSSATLELDTAIEFEVTDAQEAAGEKAVFERAMVRDIPFDQDPEEAASSQSLLEGFKETGWNAPQEKANDNQGTGRPEFHRRDPLRQRRGQHQENPAGPV